MQPNISYEESPFLNQDPEEIYDEIQNTSLSPLTSDDLQYPGDILVNRRRRRGNKRKKVKCVCFASLVCFAALCVVALLVTVVFCVVKLESVDTELRELQNKLDNQLNLLSTQRRLDKTWMERTTNVTGTELEQQLGKLSTLQ